MALIKCKECGKEVSKKAKTCPNCGAPVKKKPKQYGCGTLILLGFIMFIFIGIFSKDEGEPRTAVGKSTVTTKPKPIIPGSQWHYFQSEDSMGKGSSYTALVLSSNTVNFDFPYSGKQYGKLTIRTHPRHGKDIIFSIEKGQILCNSYDKCTVLIRFDDEKGVYFNAVGTADNSTETIFIRNYKHFVGKMLKAKRVRVAVNIYQQGSPVFEFDVSNFEQKKYKPRK